MPYKTIAELCLRIFILTIIGYFLRKKEIINDDFQSRLSVILVDVIIPFNIISAANSPKKPGQEKGMLISLAVTIAYYLFAIVITTFISKSLPLSAINKKQFVNLCVFANVGYIGFPIIQAIYGNEGMIYAVVANLVFQLVVFTYGVHNMGGKTMTVKSFILRSSTIAPVLGIILFLSPFRLPSLISTSFDILGSMSAPFSLFIIGSSLATIRFSSVWKSGWAWLVTAIRQLAFPALVALVLKISGVDGAAAATLVVLYGLPSATINVIFSQHYKADMNFATRVVSHGVIAMLITLPLSVLMCNLLFF